MLGHTHAGTWGGIFKAGGNAGCAIDAREEPVFVTAPGYK